MKTALRLLTVAAIVGGLTLPLAAAQKDGAKKKRAKKPAVPAAMYKLPKSITLSDEQKPKLAEINKEYAPKFRELGKKGRDILSQEQRKARRDAMKAGKEAGKKGKELRAEAEAAMNLTDEQKTQLAEVRKATAKLRKEMQEKVVSLLTPEQKEQLPKPKKGKRGKNRKAA